jgi:hypothetical protein
MSIFHRQKTIVSRFLGGIKESKTGLLVYYKVGGIQRPRETRQQVIIKVVGADEAFFASFIISHL